jgi:hypothetical protein
MMSDDRTIARHELAGNMKGAWIMSADSLLAGARALILGLAAKWGMRWLF